jgi:hypothetical protein
MWDQLPGQEFAFLKWRHWFSDMDMRLMHPQYSAMYRNSSPKLRYRSLEQMCGYRHNNP